MHIVDGGDSCEDDSPMVPLTTHVTPSSKFESFSLGVNSIGSIRFRIISGGHEVTWEVIRGLTQGPDPDLDDDMQEVMCALCLNTEEGIGSTDCKILGSLLVL